jgi:hypothetical protein
MRSEFLKNITPGSVLDTYVMGDVVGAWRTRGAS